jgi:cytochrome P450
MIEYSSALIAAKRPTPPTTCSRWWSTRRWQMSTRPRCPTSSSTPFSLLFAAGSDTTRNAIAGGLLALVERPDQLAALRADRSLLPRALEEILRWTTPSPAKRRTATRSTTLRDHEIEPGDKVLLWEASANRDEMVFEEPMVFDIHRDPNPHLSFGQGVHYCLGASLARLEMRVCFQELLRTFATYELAQPVEWTRSNRHTGIRHLVLRLGRA